MSCSYHLCWLSPPSFPSTSSIYHIVSSVSHYSKWFFLVVNFISFYLNPLTTFTTDVDLKLRIIISTNQLLTWSYWMLVVCGSSLISVAGHLQSTSNLMPLIYLRIRTEIYCTSPTTKGRTMTTTSGNLIPTITRYSISHDRTIVPVDHELYTLVVDQIRLQIIHSRCLCFGERIDDFLISASYLVS